MGSPGQIKRGGLTSRPTGEGVIHLGVHTDVDSVSLGVDIPPRSARRLAEYLVAMADLLDGGE